MSAPIPLTPEVLVTSEFSYLIRVDGEELGFVNTLREAQLVVDSIAASEQKRYENVSTKVFRRDLDDGNKVVLSTQKIGILMNGSVVKAMTIDCVRVGRFSLTKGRHELPKNEEVISDSDSSYESEDEDTSVPTPAVLAARLAVRARKEEDEESENEELVIEDDESDEE